MKPLMRLSMLALIAIASFTSCKKAAPKQTKFIPKDASFVATLNTKSLKDKLIKNEATIENLLKSLSNNNDTALDKGKKEWEELKNSGIDLDENMYFAVVQNSNGIAGMNMGQPGTSLTATVAGLDDAAKLEAYVKKKDASIQIQKEKDFTYATKENNMVAWGKDVIVVLSGNQMPMSDMELDSSSNGFNMAPAKPVDLKAEMIAYFNMKDDETIGSISEFNDLAAQKADGNLWINSAASISEMPIPLPKAKELLENSYTAATLNFDDGQININSKTYSSKPMGELLEKYTGSTVNLDLVKNYPSNNIAAFFVASFNPEFLNGLVKYLEVGGFVNGFITKTLGTDYTLDDVLKSIKGDMAVVFSDYNPTWSDSRTTNENGMPMTTATLNWGKMLVNIPVGDKTQFNRLMDKLVEQQMMVKANNEYALTPALRSAGFHVSLDDKQFLLGDSTIVNQYKSGTAKASLDAKLLDGFKGKSSAGFVDFEKIMSTLKADTSNTESLNAAKATFKNIRGYTDNYNGKHIEGHLEINLKNAKENSLTSLLKFFAASSKNFQQKPRMETNDTDSTTRPQVEE